MRWPLRFWPDTRSIVDDVIGFSGSNHGTTVQPPSGCSGGCPPADWQQFAGSNFIKAINSYAETFSGISYTEVYTHTDEVVQPANNNQNASAALHTGGGQITNIATQDICPLDTNEHNQIGTVDNVAYALAVDALTHPGPADPSRINPATVCSQPSMPGVNPADANTWLQILSAAPGLIAVATPVNLVGAPEVNREPQLRCYVFANCAASRFAPQLHVSVRPRHPQAGKRLLRFRVWVVEGRTRAMVGGVRIRLGRHKLRRKTNSHGVLKVRRRLRPHHRYRIIASRPGCAPGRARLRVRGFAHP